MKQVYWRASYGAKDTPLRDLQPLREALPTLEEAAGAALLALARFNPNQMHPGDSVTIEIDGKLHIEYLVEEDTPGDQEAPALGRGICLRCVADSVEITRLRTIEAAVRAFIDDPGYNYVYNDVEFNTDDDRLRKRLADALDAPAAVLPPPSHELKPLHEVDAWSRILIERMERWIETQDATDWAALQSARAVLVASHHNVDAARQDAGKEEAHP